METLSDQILITQYLRGDSTALEKLVERHLDFVLNFVYLIVRNQPVAEDITQETFVKAWQNLSKYNDQYKFKTWLGNIAKNTAIDYLRKQKNLNFSELGDSFEHMIADHSAVLDQEQLFDIANIDSVVQTLPDRYRKIIELYYMKGLNFRQIGTVLNESINTVKTKHRRAITQIKKLVS